MTQEHNQPLSKLQQKADENQEQIQTILDYLKTVYEHLRKTIERVYKLEQAEKTHSPSQSQIEELRQGQAQLQSELDALALKSEPAPSSSVAAEEELNSLREEHSRLQSQIEELKQGQAQLQSELDALALKSEPDPSSSVAAEEELNSLREEHSRLQSQIVELRQGQAQLQLELDALASKSEPDTSSTVAAEEELNSLREEYSRLQSQIVELRQGQVQLQSELDVLASKPEPGTSSTVAAEEEKSQFQEIKELLNQIQLRVTRIETDLEKLQEQGLRETRSPTQILSQGELNSEEKSVQETQTSESESETNSVEESSVSQILLAYPELNINPQEVQIITAYNSKSSAVLQNATQVSETRASLEQRRQGSSQRAIFEKARRWGEFLILTQEGVDYLIPGRRLRITSQNQNIIEHLFKLYEYQPEIASTIKLLKPAKVSPIAGNQWELVEPGALKFELIEDENETDNS